MQLQVKGKNLGVTPRCAYAERKIGSSLGSLQAHACGARLSAEKDVHLGQPGRRATVWTKGPVLRRGRRRTCGHRSTSRRQARRQVDRYRDKLVVEPRRRARRASLPQPRSRRRPSRSRPPVLTPGNEWLPAGVTGLPRRREWDAVATSDAAGTPGDELEFVALEDGRLLLEVGLAGIELEPLAAALHGALDLPYRALARRRDDLWVIGASAIEVAHLGPSTFGDDLDLTWDGETLELVTDGEPADPTTAPALERHASARRPGPYAASAHRLVGDVFEVSVFPL
jgi:hypothetical protein